MINKIIIASIISTVLYFSYNMYATHYADPMEKLKQDEIILELAKKHVIESEKVANSFETNLSIRKEKVKDINEALEIHDVGTDFSDGNHTISF